MTARVMQILATWDDGGDDDAEFPGDVVAALVPLGLYDIDVEDNYALASAEDRHVLLADDRPVAVYNTKPKRHKVRLLESIAERVDVKYIAICDSCPDKEHEFDSIEDRDAWISDHQSKVARGESGTGDHQHFSTREE